MLIIIILIVVICCCSISGGVGGSGYYYSTLDYEEQEESILHPIFSSLLGEEEPPAPSAPAPSPAPSGSTNTNTPNTINNVSGIYRDENDQNSHEIEFIDMTTVLIMRQDITDTDFTLNVIERNSSQFIARMSFTINDSGVMVPGPSNETLEIILSPINGGLSGSFTVTLTGQTETVQITSLPPAPSAPAPSAPQPIDCVQSLWDACSAPCGGGTQSRTIVVDPANNGSACGPSVQPCNEQLCT